MDQLEKLRDYRESLGSARRNHQQGNPMIWGFFSGKGGVGKTIISGSFAVSLARLGYRVLFVDADFAMPNANVIFNLDNYIDPEFILSRGSAAADMLHSDVDNLDVFMLQPQLEFNTTVISHCVDYVFQNTIEGYDFILVDAASGFTEIHRKLTRALDTMTVISTSDPASITNAYALIKLTRILNRNLDISVIVNRAFSEEVAEDTHHKLNAILSHFLKFESTLLCYFPEDRHVTQLYDEGIPLGSWPVSLRHLQVIKQLLHQVTAGIQPMKAMRSQQDMLTT